MHEKIGTNIIFMYQDDVVHGKYTIGKIYNLFGEAFFRRSGYQEDSSEVINFIYGFIMDEIKKHDICYDYLEIKSYLIYYYNNDYITNDNLYTVR